MANRSEKKRNERERVLGKYYNLVALLSLVIWSLTFLKSLLSGTLPFTLFGCIWRIAIVLFGYSTSLSGIYSSLKLGVPFSLSNDLFIITTVVAVGSAFYDFFYKLFLVIPLYGLYKLSLFVYKWATTPGPELPPQEEPKQKVKYRKIRA
ncbi:uncharacterized protein BEWA_032370 [Theileria equi strain WA]|uniref:Membrane protein, putative n=1 Tax=Theileria equi strain WA TaxID=1537102 RepID=L0AZU5_THEEQ|nr:uncharacterized protein BEWA_032370 [Theileria equi strain WA]AFZ80384.1 membrane protein, putative [Theileria equi strain WA]|eukprot:XP_004830050.1 uncharacterized protein BEWA_032370 [Theileria equi strain WA]